MRKAVPHMRHRESERHVRRAVNVLDAAARSGEEVGPEKMAVVSGQGRGREGQARARPVVLSNSTGAAGL